MTVLTPIVPEYTGMPASTISWPVAREFTPSRMSWGVMSSRNAWAAAYTGQTQSITHLADRLRVTVELPPAGQEVAGRREAYLMAASAAGNWIRLWHMVRPAPMGTLRGAPTVSTAAAAGTRSIGITTVAGATLLAGDLLSVGDQIIQCAYEGAVADGAGAMVLPLVLPLRRAVPAGAAVTWSRPMGTFQILNLDPVFDYGMGRLQQGLQVDLAEVYA